MKKLQTLFICLFFLSQANVCFAQKAESADKIIETAIAQANKESKNVFIIFHASWCGWCKKLDASMNDEKCKTFFDDNYVTVHLTVDESEKNKNLENPGAKELRNKYHGGNAGLPFFVVVDKNSNLLGDSFIRKQDQSLDTPGENMGCPAADAEVDNFAALLKKTSKLNDKQLEIIKERFKKNR